MKVVQQSTCGHWKAFGKRNRTSYRKELNDGSVNAECVNSNQSSQDTISTSISRVSGAHSRNTSSLQSRSKEFLKNEIFKFEILHGLTSYFLAFYDNNTSYGHQFVSELRCFSKYSLDLLVGWESKDILYYKTLIRDQGDRCIPKQGFDLVQNIQRDHIFQIDVSLLHRKFSKRGGNDCCKILTAYVPVCPLQEVDNGSMFLYTKCARINFICKSFMSSIKTNRLFGARATPNQPCKDNAIVAFVNLATFY